MNIIKNIFAFFFSFKGRISRLHFGIFIPIYFVIVIVFTVFNNLFSYIFFMAIMKQQQIEAALSLIGLSIVLLGILITWIKYSHLVRRIHDLGKGIKESSLFYIILIIELISIMGYICSDSGSLSLSMFTFLIQLIFFIILAFIKGTDGENQFGKKPVPFWKKSQS